MGYIPKTALIKSVDFDDLMMHVQLTDGRIISVPIIFYPLLEEATPEQRMNYEIHSGGSALYWPEIDEDIHVAGLMAGVDWQSA
jgi:hypothetical protein